MTKMNPMMKSMKAGLLSLVLVMAHVTVPPPAVATTAAVAQEALTLRGCLLLSRRTDVFALHMEYNRIAVMGHADLVNHLGHLVILTGSFEKRGERLGFIVDEITHVASSCEAQA